jgi:hypothetical protein
VVVARRLASIVGMGALALLAVFAPTADAGAQGTRAGGRKRRFSVATNFRQIHIYVADSGATIPETTTEGLQTFFLHEQEARGTHELLVRRIPAGMSEDEVVRAVSAGRLDGLALSALGGPGIPDTTGNAAVQIDVRPGRYLIAVQSVDARGRRRIAQGDFGVLRVIGIVRYNVAVPPLIHSLVRIKDDAITLSRGIDAGPTILQVEDVGPSAHELVVRKLKPGTTRAAAIRWLEAREGPAPFTQVGGVTMLSRGRSAYVYLPFEKGEYLLSCDLGGHGHRPYALSTVVTVAR